MSRNKSTVKAVKGLTPTQISNLNLIKESEGLRLEAYMPTKNDVWTIGYGHTKTAYKGLKITEAGAEELLRQDLKWVEEVIRKLVKVPLTQNQYDALSSLIFNIGERQFAKSTVLRRLNEKDYRGSAEAFLMWDKQRSKTTGAMIKLKGLTTRREKEKELFLK